MTHTTRPSSLEERVHAVWRRTRRKHLTSGLLTFVRWSIPLFLLGMTADWLLDLPSLGRLALLALIIALPFWRAWKAAWHRLSRFNATRTAVAIEEQQGGLHSLLATAIELEKSEPTPGTSASLREATLQKAETVARDLEPAKIVTFRSLRQPAMIALALGGAILTFALLNGSFLNAGLARIFNPWAVVAYPTKTKIDPGNGDLVIKEGERASLDFKLSGIVPETAILLLRTGDGEPRELELEVENDQCQYLLASASRDFSYRIEAGDAKTSWYDVDVIPAPRISGVRVDLEFPPYLDRENETIEALTLAVPESTGVTWQLTLDQPIRAAVLNRDDGEPIPLEVTGNGTRLVIDEKVEASRGYSFSWIEQEHGFNFTSPRYYLQVSSDQAPQVELTNPESNLNALLGRKLDLAVRTRDDHGIGSTKITHRVNLRPAKSITLDTPVRSGDGEQILPWDYRSVMPDLKVGDTASFFVEVTDRYPGPDGPHLSRSEARRLTFLSREDYLAQIKRKQDRLLTRVRNVYRQERAAHELVRALDPGNNGFLQTCQLEAIRQEMLREQLKETAREVQALLDDLEANNVSEAVEKEALLVVKNGIVTIAEEQIAKAAKLLRSQTDDNPTGLDEAINIVNQAARELAQLVLLRGIDYAREVFAREAHMLANEQAALRLLTLRDDHPGGPENLAARHETLSSWTRELIGALRSGMRYDKRPIAILQLTRRLKELAASGVSENFSQTAALIRGQKNSEAATFQSKTISSFLAAEFSMRTGAEYAAIMEFRATLAKVRTAHEELQATCQAMSPGDFETKHPELAATAAALRDLFVPLLLPPVPTPRPRLYDPVLPEAPPVARIRLAAEEALRDAFFQLNKGKQQSALSQQIEASRHLAELDRLLERATTELGLRTSGMASLVTDANERITRLEDFETRQIGLLEKTEEAALDEADATSFAEPQGFLAEEIGLFAKELAATASSHPDVLPLQDRLQQLPFFLGKATSNLKGNKAEDTLGFQEQAADLLAEALELARGQAARLVLLEDLYGFQRAVGNASGWMSDLVAEQEDLITATKKAKPETADQIIPVIKNLRQCLVDIAPVLDLVAGRLDAGTPLLFAGTDLEDAIFGIEDGDFLDAEDAQTVAAESLAKVQFLVSAVETQTGYTGEVVDFLHRSQSEASLIAYRQNQLRQKLIAADGKIPADLITAQTTLFKDASTLGETLQKTTGMTDDTLPATAMNEVLASLESGDATEAIVRSELAEAALTANAEKLFLIITMLHGLPAIEINSTTEPALVLLLDVLAIASDQRRLSRITEATLPGAVAPLAPGQSSILEASAKTLGTETPHPLLPVIHRHLAEAMTALKAADKAGARQAQDQADNKLRHYVIEQALILETAVPPPSSSDEPVVSESETNDLYESTANFVSDFVSGEAPKDKRTEWEVLGNRNRAALNQNFARELPLEYRAILKNYYERVAK